MTADGTGDLRALVAQVVREVVTDVARSEVRAAASAEVAATRPGDPASTAPRPMGPVHAAGRSRVEAVRITGSADLQAFAYRLLDAFENAKTRDDVRTGRLRFELAGGVAAPSAPGAVQRIEQGAVTERAVTGAAHAGARLVLGRRAVLTPLAREKARTLGVPVDKES